MHEKVNDKTVYTLLETKSIQKINNVNLILLIYQHTDRRIHRKWCFHIVFPKLTWNRCDVVAYGLRNSQNSIFCGIEVNVLLGNLTGLLIIVEYSFNISTSLFHIL